MTDTTPAPPRWTEYLPVADLLPADRNPKAHDQAALGRSVDAFGMVEPVVLDERTGKLLAGHGRTDYLTELEAAGVAPPDGVVVGPDGRWQWLVVRGIHSRDDAHAEALGIALNRVGEAGGWKRDVLADTLVSLPTDLLDATAFSADYLDDLIASFTPPDDLDALAQRHGAPEPSDFWPVLRFKVEPKVRDRYQALVAKVPGGDAEHFAWLLRMATKGARL